MLRYIFRLAEKDVTLTRVDDPARQLHDEAQRDDRDDGSRWPGFAARPPVRVRPSVPRLRRAVRRPRDLARRDHRLRRRVSLQPNAGSQGEYAGLLAIRGWHQSRGERPQGLPHPGVAPTARTPRARSWPAIRRGRRRDRRTGNVDLGDLRAKIEANAADLGALMITYPSTHGVFEEAIVEICRLVHEAGGQVYMDGANMNAQVGLSRPGDIGADVCHLNLHKTFAIPHGGGGPGMGPIGVARAPRAVPARARRSTTGRPRLGRAVRQRRRSCRSRGPTSRCSAAEGVRRATQIAILNANYLAARLEDAYPVLYVGAQRHRRPRVHPRLPGAHGGRAA